MFHLSAYWNRWSRVLTDKHPGGPFVEVNVVPPPYHHHGEGWDKVRKIWIRVHGTTRAERDVSRTYLTKDVRKLMLDNLGQELTAFLLEADILSMIDFAKYKKNQNGGCALADCLKDDKKGRTICEGCNSEVPDDEIATCACDLPFCLNCYDDHFWNCPKARQVAGIMGWRKR